MALQVMLWSAVFLCANVATFLYVLLFGRNPPWWMYGIIAVLIGQGVFSLVTRLWSKPAAGTKGGGVGKKPADVRGWL